MVKNSFGLCVVVVVFSAMGVVARASYDYLVGDNGGWHDVQNNNTEMYNQWASKYRFRVGDSIYFEYKNDSVVVVDKSGYYNCNTTNPLEVFTDGYTIFELDRAGLYYFICGTHIHCMNGQRFIVDVLNLHEQGPPMSGPNPSPFSRAQVSCTIPSLGILMATLSTIVVITTWSPLGLSYLSKI